MMKGTLGGIDGIIVTRDTESLGRSTVMAPPKDTTIVPGIYTVNFDGWE